MNINDLFERVYDAITDAHLVAWDGCHKIYLAMDDEQAQWFRDEYSDVVEGTDDEMTEALEKWWEESCGLRFISTVTTNHEDPNAGFKDLIPQFADEEDPDEDEEDDDQ